MSREQSEWQALSATDIQMEKHYHSFQHKGMIFINATYYFSFLAKSTTTIDLQLLYDKRVPADMKTLLAFHFSA